MPMHPRPSAEVSRPCVPRRRFFTAATYPPALPRGGSQLDEPAAGAIGRRDGALGPVQIERLPERLLAFGCLPRAVEHVSQVFVGLASGEEHVGRVSEIDRFPREALGLVQLTP